MHTSTDRRHFFGSMGAIAGGLALTSTSTLGQQQKRNAGNGSYSLPSNLSRFNDLSIILGRAGDRSVTANLLSRETSELFLEYGTETGRYEQKSKTVNLLAGEPVELQLTDLKPGTAVVLPKIEDVTGS